MLGIFSSAPPPFKFHDLRLIGSCRFSSSASIRRKTRKNSVKNVKKSSNSSVINQSKLSLSQVKRRTRSEKELDEETFLKHYGNDNSSHVPVMLGEVLDVFTSVTLRSLIVLLVPPAIPLRLVFPLLWLYFLPSTINCPFLNYLER